MLSQLYIKNVAVISEATIDFSQGLNVFTGETGAGKTILISAINAVLGERASKDMIRTGESHAVISALFTELSSDAADALSQAGYAPDDDTVLIMRELSADGKSSCRINGRPATLAILKAVSAHLINVHGQHDNQQLLSPGKHLGFIDGFGALDPLLEQYRTAYERYTDAKRELNEIDTDEAGKARRLDLLTYQVSEIDDADLQPGEEEELSAQRKLLRNSLHVTQALGESVSLLDGGDESAGVTGLFGLLAENMEQAARYMDAAKPVAERLTDLSYELEGISGDIRDLLDGLDCDPTRLDDVEKRLDTIFSLKKKYGADIDDILSYRDRAAEELERIETSDTRAQALREQMIELKATAKQLAAKLTKARLDAADRFTTEVQAELAFLDMPSVALSVRRTDKPLSADGADDVELFISTNVGEEAKSLAKIASGGELARIMLSIKNVLADRDAVGTLIFDEVDTGVSGRAAQKIGQKLAQVAVQRQVIVVTHLAQVAAFAQTHLLIAKTARDNRTFTSITPLDEDARTRELARIIGGEPVSGIALQHAHEMLESAKNAR